MTKTAVATFFMFCLAGCAEKFALSDGEVAKRVEESLRSDAPLVVPLGRLTVLRDGIGSREPDSLKGEISTWTFDDLRDWERIGVTKVVQVQDLSKGFSGWSDWMSLTQQGVQMRIVAAKGPRAAGADCTELQKKFVSTRYGELQCLCFAGHAGPIEKIVQNEPRTIGADHYRIAKGTFIRENPPLVAERYKTERQVAMKFAVALKYDPFASDWKVVARDLGRQDGDLFPSHTVDDLLLRAK